MAPAALTATFVTSVAGAVTYTIIAMASPGQHIAPQWAIGVVAGVGGLLGGYLGAWMQPKVPEEVLRVVLGILALATALLYVWQALHQNGASFAAIISLRRLLRAQHVWDRWFTLAARLIARRSAVSYGIVHAPRGRRAIVCSGG